MSSDPTERRITDRQSDLGYSPAPGPRPPAARIRAASKVPRLPWAATYSPLAPPVENAKPENSGQELSRQGGFRHVDDFQVVDVEFRGA